MVDVGDRVVGRDGEAGTVVETGIRMRDSQDRVRFAAKVDLDAGPGRPAVRGAYRYEDTLTTLQEEVLRVQTSENFQLASDADILRTLSLARTALDDPAGLPEDVGDLANMPAAREAYAIERLDEVMHALDVEDHPALALSTMGKLIAEINEKLTPGYDGETYLDHALDSIDSCIDALGGLDEEEDEPYECEDCAVNGEDCRTHGEAFKIARREILADPERVIAVLTDITLIGDYETKERQT